MPSPNIWTSFDYGEVEARTEFEARELAMIKIKTSADFCNQILMANPSTEGFCIDINPDLSQLDMEEVLEHSESTSTTHYILFGKDATREYDALSKPIKLEDAQLFIDGGTVEQYKEGVNTPAQLLSQSIGWNDYRFIDKEDYLTFIKAIKANGDAPPKPQA